MTPGAPDGLNTVDGDESGCIAGIGDNTDNEPRGVPFPPGVETDDKVGDRASISENWQYSSGVLGGTVGIHLQDIVP